MKKLYIVTNNASHPAHDLRDEIDNLTVHTYPKDIDLLDLLRKMKFEHGAERITIQSGGMLNAALVRNGLIDHINIVVAPMLVGGSATPTLVDGHSFKTEADLVGIKALQLTKCEVLNDSYIRIEYDVIQNTIIDPIEP